MKEITKTQHNKRKGSVESVQLEKTTEYETDDGKVQEKVSVNYKADKGNAIDNAIKTIKNSEAVHNVAATAKSATIKTFNITVTLAILGFVLLLLAVMAGIIH